MRFKLNHWYAIIGFIIVLLVNYLSAFGIIFPYTQAEVSDYYVNVLAPAGFVFSIWGLIYLGVVLNLSMGFSNSETTERYEGLVVPLMVLWMVFNIIWIVTWSFDLIFPALIAIILYTLVLMVLTNRVAEDQVLSDHTIRLALPIGLHTGWLMVASWTNLMTLMVKMGFDGTSNSAVIVSLIFLVIALLATLFMYRKTGNHAIMLPLLWALIGIISKHQPGSSFEYASSPMLVAAIVLLIIGMIAYFKTFTDIRKVEDKNQKLKDQME